METEEFVTETISGNVFCLLTRGLFTHVSCASHIRLNENNSRSWHEFRHKTIVTQQYPNLFMKFLHYECQPHKQNGG